MNAFLLITRNLVSEYCGPKDGGNYDLDDACPVCGTGARRLDPITLPVSRLKNRVSNTLKFEVVIPPRLVGAIKSLAPQCLREIRTGKARATTPFFELIPEITLPRWSAATTGWCISNLKMTAPCPVCKRDGYFNTTKMQLRLAYDKPIPPFSVAETYEHFGKSRLQPDFKKSLFAVPFLVVSEAMKDTLKDEHGVEFVPVSFA